MEINQSMVHTNHVDPNQVWSMIEDFSSYGFNKSHAVGYTLVSYMTARIWTYHKYELLQYEMNFGGKTRRDKAVAKAKEMGLSIVYPNLRTMAEHHHTVTETEVIIPGNMDQSFDNVGQFLFSDLKSKGKAINMGVLDTICNDRKGLVELVKALGTKAVHPGFPPCQSMTEVLQNAQMAGLLTYTDRGNQWDVEVIKRGRTGNKHITLRKIPDAEVLDYNIQQDRKTFGLVRPGLLSEAPHSQVVDIYEERFPVLVDRYREKYHQRGLEGDDLRRQLQQSLKKHTNQWKWDQEKKLSRVLRGEYKVLLKDIKSFPAYTKVTVLFSDQEQVFFIRNKGLISELQALGKNSVVNVVITLDPWISKNLDFNPGWKLDGVVHEAEVQLGVTEELM